MINFEKLSNNHLPTFKKHSLSLKNWWLNLQSSTQKLLKLLAILLVLAAIPLTMYLNQQEQNLNNFAATLSSCNNGLVCEPCTPAANTCSYGNGIQSCSYTTSIDGQACNPVNFASVICYKVNCSAGYSCVNQQCVTPTGLSPTPIVGAYNATYTATTESDQTAALKLFIESNRGKRIAISGVVPVTSVVVTLTPGATTTIDFLPGAKIKGIATGVFGILRLSNSWDLVLNDAHIEGTSYNWVSTQSEATQNEDGILILGGGNITMNRPEVHDTRGDGIYVGIDGNLQTPPVAIVANDVKLYRNSRNGITPNAGQLTVTGGTIDQSGLHNIDMEPNNDAAAKSIRFIASNLRLTRHANLTVNDPGGPPITGFAIAGLGYSDAQKQLIDIRNVTSDKFTIAMDRADVAYFMNNSSDTQVTCNNTGVCADTVFIYGMTSLTMNNNTNMIINTVYDIAGPR